MSLPSGSRVGTYEILDLLGAGGMGEVYRARHGMMRRPSAIKLLRADQSGEAEVQQLDARRREHHIGRFEIAMDDVLAMRRGQGRRDVASRLQGLRQGEGAARQPVGERRALEVLHDEIGRGFAVARLAPDIVQRADVRVAERRDHPGFTLEALAPLGICRERLREHLDRDGAVQTGVECPVNLAHAAGADERHDFVGTEASAGRDAGHRTGL